MTNIKEESLKKALTASHNMELPKQLIPNDERFWIEAIVLVKKQNCTQSYATARHRGDGSIDYMADFGLVSPIVGIVSIHPYLYLDNVFLSTSKGSALRSLLAKHFANDEAKVAKIKAAKAEDLEAFNIEYAIEQQAKGASKANIQNSIDEYIERNINNQTPDDDEEEEPPILIGAKQQ